MANWWNPWTYGTYVPEIVPLELLNWALPYMAPGQATDVGRYLYSQRTAQPELEQWIGQSYLRPAGPTDTTMQWLQKISGAPGAQMPDYMRVSPEGDWFEGLLSAASGLRPTMTRQQQAQWGADLGRRLAQAPSEAMRGVGEAMFLPTLTRPEYGSVPMPAQYTMPYRTKGGLMPNPWFV